MPPWTWSGCSTSRWTASPPTAPTCSASCSSSGGWPCRRPSPRTLDRAPLKMSAATILVIDGNRALTREQQVAAGGSPTGEGYARTLESLAGVQCEIVRPADGEVRLAHDGGLAGYDGVAITGSALNVYDGGPHIERQVELARGAFAAGVPFFGSCWGMQVAVTAAGGRVRPNPLGREFGFARRIELNDAGKRHAMFA